MHDFGDSQVVEPPLLKTTQCPGESVPIHPKQLLQREHVYCSDGEKAIETTLGFKQNFFVGLMIRHDQQQYSFAKIGFQIATKLVFDRIHDASMPFASFALRLLLCCRLWLRLCPGGSDRDSIIVGAFANELLQFARPMPAHQLDKLVVPLKD